MNPKLFSKLNPIDRTLSDAINPAVEFECSYCSRVYKKSPVTAVVICLNCHQKLCSCGELDYAESCAFCYYCTSRISQEVPIGELLKRLSSVKEVRNV